MFSNRKIEEMEVGLILPDENTAVDAVLGWGERAFCPLMKGSGRDRREKEREEMLGLSSW